PVRERLLECLLQYVTMVKIIFYPVGAARKHGTQAIPDRRQPGRAGCRRLWTGRRNSGPGRAAAGLAWRWPRTAVTRLRLALLRGRHRLPADPQPGRFV